MSGGVPTLTRRERDVLVALCSTLANDDAFAEPASTRQVAQRLGVSEAAVKQHLLHLYDKFELYEGEVHRRVRLANIVLAAGVISRPKLGRSAPSEAAIPLPADNNLAAAWDAVRLRNWASAYDRFAAADAAGEAPRSADLAAFGDAALWDGHPEASIAARQRAYAAYVAEGNGRAASGIALSLVINNIIRVQLAAASGWYAKAKRHLEAEGDCVERGMLAFTEALFALAEGKAEEALRLAEMAFAAGERFGDDDLRALGLVFKGYALSQLGRPAEAAPLFDEAMTSAVAGDLGPLATGLVYCRTICASLESLDFRRALEWTDAVERAAVDRCMAGFHGDCRTHRASIHVLRGDWATGESEARLAGAESESFDLMHTGMAVYEIGMVRLRTGDLAGAEAAFMAAVEHGIGAHPGLALLQLARGHEPGALDSIRRAINAAPPESLERTRLLAAAAEIAHACGDAAEVRQVAAELAQAASKFPTVAIKASAAAAMGLATVDRDPAEAAEHLRHACRLWLEVEAPYEVARVRVNLARALIRVGDRTAAGMELRIAIGAFERLGAVPDARAAARQLGQDGIDS